MKMVKSLLLGSAAGLTAMTGAQAADLPVKAKPVEYVRVCSLYGPGFFYIPGTETCLKIGGFTMLEASFGDAQPGSHAQRFNGNVALNTRDNDYFHLRARANLSFDVRAQTAYGTLRSFALVDIYMNTSNPNYNFPLTANTTNVTLGQGFIQFAGFTLGKAVPVLRAPFHNTIWTATSLFGYSDVSGALVGTLQAVYTAELGNGASLTFGIEDATYSRQPLYDTVTAFTTPFTSGAFPNSYGGQYVPDFVGNFRFDQAWGGAFLGAKVRNMNATYYALPGAGGAPGVITQLNGNPRDVVAFGVNAGLQFKNLPTGVGDQIQLFASYGDGMTTTSGSIVPPPSVIGITGRSTGPGIFQSLAYVPVLDGVYNVGLGRIAKTQSYGFQAGFEHYWVPGMLRSSVFAGYSRLDYNGAANAALCVSAGRTVAAGGQALAGSNCNFDADFWNVGTRTVWTPVRSLDLVAEFLYTRIDTKLTGTVTPAAAAFKPAATYSLRDQDVYSGFLRAIRVF